MIRLNAIIITDATIRMAVYSWHDSARIWAFLVSSEFGTYAFGYFLEHFTCSLVDLQPSSFCENTNTAKYRGMHLFAAFRFFRKSSTFLPNFAWNLIVSLNGRYAVPDAHWCSIIIKINDSPFETSPVLRQILCSVVVENLSFLGNAFCAAAVSLEFPF